MMAQFSKETIIEVYSSDDGREKNQTAKIPRRQRNNLPYQSAALLEHSFNLERRQKWNEDKKGIT